ncbi:hypothetical protein [Terasakiella sp. SH-1]|uniref:hypothetical protein n=1 Tax=Terasakiella sp. SH-1 TaxID=2560057 RepID=UPI0010730FE8|nr:hypothetical protein [Terasakiella sp. SH-1]
MLRLLTFAAFLSLPLSQAKGAEVIELTQTPCQFIEGENGMDHGFQSNSSADCDKINAQTKDKRLADARPLTLKAGTHTFRVTNKNIPYTVGFWLRDKDYNWKNPLHKLSKTSVSGGGLTQGVSKTFTVDLKPGEYLYSCPLNPTLDYKLIVK